MKRRKFLTAVGATGTVAVAGCINPTQKYNVGDTVSVREGEIALSGVRASKTIFTQPIDTPPSILGRDDSQFIILRFSTLNLDVRDSRKHDYLTDNLQFRLSPDTVVEIVQTPLRVESQEDGIVGVAFRVTEPFDVGGSTVRWTGDTNAVWSAESIFTSEVSSYLGNPPEFTVDGVDIPDSVSEDTATITTTVTNEGPANGEFKLLVRGDDTKYESREVLSNKTVDIPVEITISGSEQPVVVSWGYDQRSGTVERQ